ncbi:MAG: thiamine phosphate synthase [Candidatus Latescibacterota bacterium]|nr:MAG: thiamine phosphate synthase [Candidatus Latescibacterota bacterium]
MKMRIGRLHVLTDTSIQNRFTHVEIARFAIQGGADTIQLREKNKDTGELFEIAREVGRVCREANVPLIINDRADIALATGAAGVHLGRDDLPIAAAREILGPAKIIGGSASTLEEALEAERDGADYVGFGHIYPTSTKSKKGAPRGIETLRAVTRALKIPVIAIGGIDRKNILPVVDAGSWGVAVIAAVCGQTDPRRATGELKIAIDSSRNIQKE